MEQIPGIAILVFLSLVGYGIVRKLTGDQLVKALEGRGFLLIATLLLFGLVLSLHLFQGQTWTADVLKVLAGIIVGGSASYSGMEKATSSSGVDARGGVFGHNARVAGRDINETIEKMEAEVAQIRDSVFHQNTTVQQIAERTSATAERSDYLLNTVYERGDRVAAGIARAMGHWTPQGWQFVGLSSDYAGMDGVTLVFRRPQRGPELSVTYWNGSNYAGSALMPLAEYTPSAV